MADTNSPKNPESIDETYLPSDVKIRRDREDWSNLVRSYVCDLIESELYSKYLLPDKRCGFWPQKNLAAMLGDGHKGFADIWPVDRSAHVVGVSREHVTHNNALIDIPAGKKTATFETGLDMLISEIFGNYECEHRRSGTRESSILEMDSDVYYQLKQRGEKETNDILDLVAKLIDQMLVCKQGALQNGMNWKSIGMTPPSYTTNGPQQVTSLPDIVDSIDWRIVMHCAEHVGVPENVIKSSRKRLEEWYAVSDDRRNDNSLERNEEQKTGDDKHTQLPRRRQAALKDASVSATRTANMQTRSANKRKSPMDAEDETSSSKQPRNFEESTSE